MAEKEELKELIAYIQGSGFIFGPEPEIYGGVAGFYTYGPLGKLLKNKVEGAIRRVFNKYDFYEVECPIVMPSKVWEASGHLGGFTDPLVECSSCKAIFRADNLIEEKFPDMNLGGVNAKQMLKMILDKNIRCPSCKHQFKSEIKDHSLMMKTSVGVGTEAYNRPETATTTYLPYPRYLQFFRDKLPFGVFQIGKAFRNEISPRQHVIRGREFTQAEGQLFIFENQKANFEKFRKVENNKLPLWDQKSQDETKEVPSLTLADAMKNKILKNQAYAWTLSMAYELFLEMGIPSERIRLRQHHQDEMAFYADDAWDIEVKLKSFGWTECCGVHDRTNYDLTQHAKFSGQKLEARDENNEKQVPHVLEIAFGSDRPTFALLDIFYDKKSKDEGKTMFKVPYNLAPIDIAVLPLLKKPDLLNLSEELVQSLRKSFVVQYDVSAAIGRRYLRQDSIGTPYCVTVDFDSLENNDITIRDRDSTEQVRVKITELKEVFTKLLEGELKFKDIKA